MTPAPQPQAPAPGAGTARPGRRALLALAYALAFSLFAWWLDRRMLGVAREAYFGWFVLGNALPGLVVAGLLTALTLRPGFSFLLVTTFQWLVYHASTLKLAVLDDPVGLQDLYFITSLDRSSIALLGQYVERPALLGLAALAGLAVAVGVWRLEAPAFRALRATQGVLALATLALLYTMVASLPPWNVWYSKDTLRPSRFAALPAILHGGLMSNLVYTHNKDMQATQIVDAAAVRQLLRAVPVRTQRADARAMRPDVVIVLSESLFDPRIMKGTDGLPDTLPNIRAAIASGHGGEMKVPTFGGGTIRTEFEVLTGMPMQAFPNAQFPYVTLVRDRIPGLVSELKEHGYRAVAVHGNAGTFWNRQNAYKSIGFDRFITEREFPRNAARNGRWISDAVMTDLVLDELHRARQPTLVLALSMENHGPYTDPDTTDQAARDSVPVPAGLSPAQALQLRNYLYHAHRADAQFGRLLDELRARRRPAVVLFFGDHLPGMRDVFDAVGFRDGRPATKQFVPWVLVRTDRPEATTVRHAESWMLPGMLLHLAGLQDDPYFELTRALSERLGPSKSLPPGLSRGLDAAAVARIQGTFAGYAGSPVQHRGSQ